MAASPILSVGQFSESPVLAIARALGLDRQYDVDWVTKRVPSSPGQFDWLRSGEIDLAITSPDNVLLYATTASNPLSEQLDLRLLRPIDRGLGLALYTRPDIASVGDFTGASLGVDVLSSGFALLLLRMLADLGIDRDNLSFEAVGATPKRLEAIASGAIAGSILNAESAVAAEDMGLTRWATSVDVSDNYLGTVLVQLAGEISPPHRRFLDMWEEATQAILSSPADSIVEGLSAHTPQLANLPYVSILQSADFGCLAGEVISEAQLHVLAEIRRATGAYAPSDEAIARLVANG